MMLNPALAIGSGPASALFGLPDAALYVCSNPATLIGVLVTAATGLPPVPVVVPVPDPVPAAPSADELSLPLDWPFCWVDPDPALPPEPGDATGPGELWFEPVPALVP